MEPKVEERVGETLFPSGGSGTPSRSLFRNSVIPTARVVWDPVADAQPDAVEEEVRGRPPSEIGDSRWGSKLPDCGRVETIKDQDACKRHFCGQAVVCPLSFPASSWEDAQVLSIPISGQMGPG